ncbi:MAG: HD domain-containing protein [Spirochaetota bacterium]|nr:HD domain-containing protein [Spirochaetota bacterium]
MIKEIFKKLPYPIRELKEIIGGKDIQLWLYGETVCELCFTDIMPRHYQLATTLTKDYILNKLDIHVSEVHSNNNDLILFYQEGKYHPLNKDFLPDNIKENYYIEISCVEADFVDKLKSQPISVDQIAWDFNEFFNTEQLIKDFETNCLKIYNDDRESIFSNLLNLFKLSRYLIKFSIPDRKLASPVVETLNNKQDNKKIVSNYFWKREFIKILELSKPSECFELLREWNILSQVLSELIEGYNVVQNKYHEYDVYYHGLSTCDAASVEEPIIRLAGLLHDIGKPRSKRIIQKELSETSQNVFYDHENIGARMAYQVLRRFGFTHSTVTNVTKLVRLHMFHYTTEWTDNAVRRFLRKANIDLNKLFKLRNADRLGSGKKDGDSKAIQNLERRIKEIQEIDNRLTVKDLNINGHDIMTHFSLQPGPIVGNLLNYLLEIVVEDSSKNKKDVLLSYAENWLKNKSLLMSQKAI